jgi:hypothetical protein
MKPSNLMEIYTICRPGALTGRFFYGLLDHRFIVLMENRPPTCYYEPKDKCSLDAHDHI